MAQNTYIIRGNDVIFGIPDGLTVPWGVVTSIKRKPSNTVAEFTADNGEIGTRVSYQNKEVYTLEIIRASKSGNPAGTLPMPTLDDLISYNGKDMVFSAIDDSYTQGDAQKLSVELTYYPYIAMPSSTIGGSAGAAPYTDRMPSVIINPTGSN